MSKRKKRKAGYARQRQVHKRMRNYPSRGVFQLSQAVERLGWKVIGWEYEVNEGDWYAWYDCAVTLHGRLCFIDIVGSPGRGLPKRNKEILKRKEEYCERHDIPYLKLPPAGVIEQQGKLAIWSMRLGRIL
jgi:hypothetical protein